jgi:hypothetical protein
MNSWLARRYAGATELARAIFIRTGKRTELVKPVPAPTYEVRLSDWKVVRIERGIQPLPGPVGDKNAELRAVSINKQWHAPKL